MRRTLRDAGSAVVLATVLALGTAACTGSDEPESEPPASSPGRPAAFETRAWVAEVVGRLPARDRPPAVRAVTKVVGDWTDAAYLEGDYPRTSFRDFPGFTPGARRMAARDAALTTNADIGARVEQVTPVRRTVAIDLLAHRRRPVAATARVVLQFDTAGEVERRVTVRARLRLTRGGGRWQVFAYDVTKAAAAKATPTSKEDS